jgi:hypothetical protein
MTLLQQQLTSLIDTIDATKECGRQAALRDLLADVRRVAERLNLSFERAVACEESATIFRFTIEFTTDLNAGRLLDHVRDNIAGDCELVSKHGNRVRIQTTWHLEDFQEQALRAYTGDLDTGLRVLVDQWLRQAGTPGSFRFVAGPKYL